MRPRYPLEFRQQLVELSGAAALSPAGALAARVLWVAPRGPSARTVANARPLTRIRAIHQASARPIGLP